MTVQLLLVVMQRQTSTAGTVGPNVARDLCFQGFDPRVKQLLALDTLNSVGYNTEAVTSAGWQASLG